MRTPPWTVRAALAALLLTGTAGASAQTVYRSVQDGVVSFSDTAPEDGAAEVVELDVPQPGDDGLLQERLAQMRETTDRMAADRRERETARRDARAAAATAAVPTPAQPAVVAPVWATSHWSGGYRPWRPRPPFHPVRPLPSPTPSAPPGWSVLQPGNAQLMRPIVSGRP